MPTDSYEEESLSKLMADGADDDDDDLREIPAVKELVYLNFVD
jgi:hypothetical protein